MSEHVEQGIRSGPLPKPLDGHEAIQTQLPPQDAPVRRRNVDGLMMAGALLGALVGGVLSSGLVIGSSLLEEGRTGSVLSILGAGSRGSTVEEVAFWVIGLIVTALPGAVIGMVVGMGWVAGNVLPTAREDWSGLDILRKGWPVEHGSDEPLSREEP